MEIKIVLPDFENYCRDESRMAGKADSIVFPRDTEELAQAIAYGADRGLSVAMQGARTGIVGSAVPSGGLIVSTEKMNALLGLRRAEDGAYYLRLQAGCTLEQVHGFLRRPVPDEGWSEESKRLCEQMGKAALYFFPPNPTEATATIGGLFTTNAKGMNSLRYGSVGDHVQGLTWISPQGKRWEIARGQYRFDEKGCTLPDGSRLDCPTDVAPGGIPMLAPFPDMDLMDFLAGSEGWIGAVAELVLRLSPAPTESWGVIYYFSQGAQAMAFADFLAQWREAEENAGMLSSVEYYDESVLELLRENKENLSALKSLPELPKHARAALYVVLQGEDAAALEEALEAHLGAFDEAGGKDEDSWAAMGESEIAAFDTLRHSIPELINMQVDALRLQFPDFCKTATDFAGPPDLAREYSAMYRQDMAQRGIRGYVFGHYLENRLHVNLLAQDHAEWASCRKLMQDWATRVVSEGGLIAGESGLGKLRLPLYSALVPEERKQQLQSIQRSLDPSGCMAMPGWDES